MDDRIGRGTRAEARLVCSKIEVWYKLTNTVDVSEYWEVECVDPDPPSGSFEADCIVA